MCGLAGIVGPTRDRSAVIRAMTAAIAHRGPDGEGFYEDEECALGHRRLAVIDLSPLGAQPMGNEDGSIQVVFNGEIYNHEELRRSLESKGHRFRSRSDTEVLVHLYEELGDRCAEPLNGMFAFAIWDSTRKRLVLARDRFGQKPLFYAEIGGCLVFASEIKALLRHPDLPRQVSPEAIDSFLTVHFVPAPGSFYASVRRLEAATVLVKEHGCEPSRRRFWRPEMAPRRSVRFEEAEEQVDALLTAAVRRQLVADVPVGIFLSGGIDSTLLLTKLSRIAPPGIDAFSAGYREARFSELPHAAQAAAQFGARLHPVLIDPAEFVSPERILDMFDEPFADIAAIPTAMLSHAARQKITVALTGDGGDELFGGYEHHIVAKWLHWLGDAAPWRRAAAASLADLLRHQNRFRSPLRRLRRGLSTLAARDWKEAVASLRANCSSSERSSLYTSDFAAQVQDHDPYEPLLPAAADGAVSIERLFSAGEDRVFGDLLLHKTDVSSMAAGLECRSPFLDVPLSDYAATLPLEHLVHGTSGKYILRRLLARRVGAAISSRRKMGFTPPVDEWLRGELAPLVRDLLLAPSAEVRAFVEQRRVDHLFAEHCARRADNKRVLWALLLLELWLRRLKVPLGVDRAAGTAPYAARARSGGGDGRPAQSG